MKKLAKGKMGSIMLDPNTSDEYWHVYNVIEQGDHILAKTSRKVKLKNNVTQVFLNLEIEVESVELDAESSIIRIHGKNLTKNEYIGMGVYHTLQIDNSTLFKVSKTVWNDTTLHHLKDFYNARNPKVAKHISSKNQSKDMQVFQDWLNLWERNPDQAVYGSNEVFLAQENNAIEKLLLSDSLFRNNDVDVRKKFVDLADAVKAKGGKVHIFPLFHVSSQDLEKYTGIAAVLRFPMPEINEIEHD